MRPTASASAKGRPAIRPPTAPRRAHNPRGPIPGTGRPRMRAAASEAKAPTLSAPKDRPSRLVTIAAGKQSERGAARAGTAQ
jgi:hypothetical protein